MILFNFKLPGSTVDDLRQYSSVTGLPVAEYLRRLIDADQDARRTVLSGGVVTSRTLHTTSGDLQHIRRF